MSHQINTIGSSQSFVRLHHPDAWQAHCWTERHVLNYPIPAPHSIAVCNLHPFAEAGMYQLDPTRAFAGHQSCPHCRKCKGQQGAGLNESFEQSSFEGFLWGKVSLQCWPCTGPTQSPIIMRKGVAYPHHKPPAICAEVVFANAVVQTLSHAGWKHVSRWCLDHDTVNMTFWIAAWCCKNDWNK